MKKSEKTFQEQEAIIAEYLLGDTTYRKLGSPALEEKVKLNGWSYLLELAI